MTELENQVLETWRVHNRINIFLIRNIPEKAFKATLSRRGGRDIARQLAHVHMVRIWRLEPFIRRSKLDVLQFEKGEGPSRKRLLTAFEQSGNAMEKYIQYSLANGGKVSNFRRGVVPMLGYYISHEAHHRGSILLTMKQSGISLPSALKWGIWEWNKI